MKIFDVIRNERPELNSSDSENAVLAWRFEGEDFYDKSQLIVHESEEAVFFRDGLALEVFEGGRYTLETSSHPFLAKLRSKLSGGKNAFSSQIYFVNRVHRLELKWGTDSPVQVRDPVWGIATKVQARGSYSIQVADSKKFLIKLVGNMPVMSEREVSSYYRSAFSQFIKDAIADHLMSSTEEIINIANKKSRLAVAIKQSLIPLLDEYGLELVNFYVASIDIPDDEYRFRVEGSIADRQVKLQGALGDRGVMDVLGENWGRQQSAEILRDLANNPGAGGVAAAGAGLGLGMAAGGVFNEMARSLVVPPSSQPASRDSPRTPSVAHNDLMPVEPEHTRACAKCGTPQPIQGKFCRECGNSLIVACADCGTPGVAGTKFCAECGARFGDDQ